MELGFSEHILAEALVFFFAGFRIQINCDLGAGYCVVCLRDGLGFIRNAQVVREYKVTLGTTMCHLFCRIERLYR